MASMIQELAKEIGRRFPELGGRSIAVSEVEPFDNQTSYPNLPIAVTALIHESGDQPSSGGGRIKLSSDVLIQFIFEPVKYTIDGGEDTPFFAFYDYEKLRDRIILLIRSWRTPRNGSASYKSVDIDSDEFAVYIAFRLSVNEIWCQTEELDDPFSETASRLQIFSRVLQPRGKEDCCDPCEVLEDPCARPSEQE